MAKLATTEKELRQQLNKQNKELSSLLLKGKETTSQLQSALSQLQSALSLLQSQNESNKDEGASKTDEYAAERTG